MVFTNALRISQPRISSVITLSMPDTSKPGPGIKLAILQMEEVVVLDVSIDFHLKFAFRSQIKSDQTNPHPSTNHSPPPDIQNVTFRNFTLLNLRGPPISITQCTRFAGADGDCNSSKFEIKDLKIDTMTGTLLKDPVGLFQCSAAAPCTNIAVNAVDLHLANGTAASGWLCDNLEGNSGFNCTGNTCGKGSSTGVC